MHIQRQQGQTIADILVRSVGHFILLRLFTPKFNPNLDSFDFKPLKTLRQ